MENWAVCAECGNRYDVRAAGFCTRCGSTQRAGAGTAGAAGPASRGARIPADPLRRRRARLGGTILASLGALVMVGCLAGVLQFGGPHDEVGPVVAASAPPAGGTVRLTVVDGGVPVANASVEVQSRNGTRALQASTDAQGQATLALGNTSAFRLLVTHPDGRNATRDGVVFFFQDVPTTVDLAASGPQPWIGLDDLVRYTRAVILGMAVVGGLALLGGILAILGRAFPVAVAASLPMPLVTMLLVAAFLSVGALAFLLLQVTGVVLVATSRAGFLRK